MKREVLITQVLKIQNAIVIALQKITGRIKKKVIRLRIKMIPHIYIINQDEILVMRTCSNKIAVKIKIIKQLIWQAMITNSATNLDKSEYYKSSKRKSNYLISLVSPQQNVKHLI